MSEAVARISEAIKNGERILVHGDYDADGVTATAILFETLGRLGAEASYYIPDRAFGYGMGLEGVRRAREAGASLIITVDCGITSFEAVSSARALGIDVVITDHHEPLLRSDHSASLPEAVAIINPMIDQADSVLSILSGAGVAFKLAQALLGNSIENAHGLLDLAALGTAADVVPLVADNRIMVKEGCNLIWSGARPGIAALGQAAGIKANRLKASTLQFMLIPRINAAGRIADASDVVRLLLTESADEASGLAEWLNGLNIRRQAIGESVYEQAMEIIHASGMGASGSGAMVVGAEGWHPGVLGIVAARIADTFYRPAFVFSIKDGIAKGSARSIPAFDVHAGLNSCSSLLKSYGGHKQAAGLSLPAADLDVFGEAISHAVLSTLSAGDLAPSLRIDAPLRVSEISNKLISEISRLEPFGCGNEEPLFGARGLEVSQARIVGNNHLKMHLRQQGRGIDSIGFNLGGMLGHCKNGDVIDAAFLPVMNEWEGGRTMQLNLRAVRASAENGI
jgi:single-stranded-DNA-specific exonuclease